jgi:hypothetical protein
MSQVIASDLEREQQDVVREQAVAAAAARSPARVAHPSLCRPDSARRNERGGRIPVSMLTIASITL